MPANSKSVPRLINVIRDQLFAELGNACEACGALVPLEINHIYKTKTYKSASLGSYQRWLTYRREARLGLVNLLCKECNSRYRPLDLIPYETCDESNCPF